METSELDGLYGPTETLIVADSHANPTLCAADLLAQAEHDPMARPVLVCDSTEFAERVSREVCARLERLERASVAGASVEGQGLIAVVSGVSEAVELANWFAPEHLCLSVEGALGVGRRGSQRRRVVHGRVFARGSWRLHSRSGAT